jgi:hypothetical protein
MQSQPDFETLFREACAATGPAYLAARDAILAMPRDTSVMARLQAAKASSEPGQAMTAGILLVRMARPEEVHQAQESLDGRYPKPRWQKMRIVNDWPEWRMESASTHLGDDLVFLALENLFKSRRYPDARNKGWMASSLAAEAAKDSRWNDAMLSIVTDADYDQTTRFSTGVFLLHTMKDERMLPFFRAFLAQKPLDGWWASSAMAELARARDQASVPRIKAIALDGKMNEWLREVALEALVTMRVPGTQDILLKALATARRPSHLPVTVASGLAEVGDRRAVPVIKRIVRLYEGEDAAAVEHYLQELNARLAVKAH